MTDTGNQIASLINSKMSGPDMCHALKRLGGDAMQKGVAYCMEEATEKGLSTGRLQGAVGGCLGTLMLGFLIHLAVRKKEQNAAHEAEGQEILKAMQANTTTAEIITKSNVDDSPSQLADDKDTENAVNSIAHTIL